MAVVERSAQLRVPTEQVPQARLALAGVPGLSVGLVEGQPNVLSIRAGKALNAAVVAVAEAGVPILSFQVEGARLSDAYRKVTTTDVR